MKRLPIGLYFFGIILFAALSGCLAKEREYVLEGTTWALTLLKGDELIDGTAIEAEFTEGLIRGSAGCNQYGADYEVSSGKFVVGMRESTLEGCIEPEGVMEQENEYLQLLQMSKSFEIVDDELKFYDENGEVGLVFTRSVDDGR